jgi:hypothetical protein
LPLFFLMTAPRRWIYLGGAGLGLLPLAWLTAVAGPAELINNLLLFPVIYSSPSRHLPILSAESHLVFLLIAHLAAVTANIFAGVLALRANPRDLGARLLLGLALFGLCLTHQTLQRIDLAHVIFAAFASLGLLPLSIFVIQSRLSTAMPRGRDALLATAAVLVLLQAIAPAFAYIAGQRITVGLGGEADKTVFITQHGRFFPISSLQTALMLGKIFDRLDALAAPGDRLFVGPADLRRTNYNDTFVYHMMPQLRPATYFLDNWNEKNDSIKFGSDRPMQVVEQQFELCGRYGPCDLYRRKPVGKEGASNSTRSLFQDVQRPKQIARD